MSPILRMQASGKQRYCPFLAIEHIVFKCSINTFLNELLYPIKKLPQDRNHDIAYKKEY